MINKIMYSLARPVLFSMDPETAHNFTMRSLQLGAASGMTVLMPKPKDAPRKVMGVTFPNPVGLAAGLDKSGYFIDGVAAMGFGFLELGTVTPRPQKGHPRPRMWRLKSVQGLINRFGFENDGVDVMVENVRKSRFFRNKEGVIGLSIGKGAETPLEQAVDDYRICLEKVYPVSDYVAVNVSSANTKGLRELLEEPNLDKFLAQLKDTQKSLADQYGRYVPMALKISGDMPDEKLKVLAATLLRNQMDGVIAANATTRREMVQGLPHAEESGGLSGAPVRDIATHVIKLMKSELGNEIPILGVGGIMSAADAKEKADAGASLVEVLTGLVYRGPALVKECVDILR